jgi:hypothetical protein
MHETLHSNVKGFIDESINFSNFTYVRGWSFHERYGVCPLRLKYGNTLGDVEVIPRKDVTEHFNKNNIILCGWRIKFPKGNFADIQMEINNEWHTIFSVNSSNASESPIVIINDDNKARVEEVQKQGQLQQTKSKEEYSNPKNEIVLPENISVEALIKKFAEQNNITSNYNVLDARLSLKIPSFVVVDNFYENPDSVRNFALSQAFNEHKDYHKGKRTDNCFRFNGIKEDFERILGVKIKNWDKYGTNGCFQICVAGDQIVYHNDVQEYAAVLFLTPDAPINTGTSFYRSKHTKTMKPTADNSDIIFKNGFLDSTEFEMVDTVGNVYNRIVLFDSKMIHAATQYFGTNEKNGRLFQLFFFDLDN